MPLPSQHPLHVPPQLPGGVDVQRVLSPLYHSAWLTPGRAGAEYRRSITEHDPLLFALTYLPSHLIDDVTGRISFSRMHLDMARDAQRWAHPRCYDRVATVAPRESAKTTWNSLLLPLWATAHRHRRFPLQFSYTGDLARGHLSSIRDELASNDLLLADFPDMTPARGAGVRTTGGAVFEGRGLGEAKLGRKRGSARPDLLVGDDLEPLRGWTPKLKRDVVHELVHGILPMNTRGVVQLSGTTVAYGSLMHDLVRSGAGRRLPDGDWPTAQSFRTRHYRAIEIDPRTGEEGSLWPQRWPLAELQALREADPWGWSLNYECDPSAEAAGGVVWWTPELIRYDPRAEVTWREMWVDVAVTPSDPSSDYTTIVVAGYDAARRCVVVEHAEQHHWDNLQLQEGIWRLHRNHPRTLRHGVIETNQGGELWQRNMRMPPGFELESRKATTSKAGRIKACHRHYKRNAVLHRENLPELEQQMLDWPQVRHDDLVDALAGAVDAVFMRAGLVA